MSLVWCVPVVAAAVAAGLVAGFARPLEDAGRELADAVARLTELRWRFAQLRVTGREADARVTTFRERHALGPGSDDGPEG